MIRVILYRAGGKPRVIRLDVAPGDGHAVALGELLGVPDVLVTRLRLHDGIELCCDRDGLLLGLSLARRKLTGPPAIPRRPESTLCFDRPEPVLRPDEWLVSADFLLVRVVASGELVDLTEADIRHWMFWLGLDYIMTKR